MAGQRLARFVCAFLLCLLAAPGLASAERLHPLAEQSLLRQESDEELALREVIDGSNLATVDAICSGDPTPMMGFFTDTIYEGYTDRLAEEREAGVVGAAIHATEWGVHSIDHDRASTATYEAWELTFDDGSTMPITTLNYYNLVRIDGGWLIDGVVTNRIVQQPR